jgi:hypothetical protein
LLAAAILLVGGLAWSVASLPPATADLADAARWEGQTVALGGWASDVHQSADGSRFTLVDGSAAVAVRVIVPTEPPVAAGDRVQATGRLGRWQGQLRLEVETPAGIRRLPEAQAESPAWDDVASDPAHWQGHLLLLRGEVDDGRLRDGPNSVALGEGPWPRTGSVQARGLLRNDPACLCHRFDAREVWAWTP